MVKSKLLSKIIVVLFYLLAILVFFVAFLALATSSILGFSWVLPLFGLAFSLILFWLVNKTPRANEILPLLAILFRPIKDLLEIETKKNRYYPFIREIEHIINFFNLNSRFEKGKSKTHYYNFSDDFRESTIKTIPQGTENDYDVLMICTKAVERISTPPITSNVLLTLCLPKEHREANIIFERVKSNETELNDLAKILESCQHLPKKTLVPYTKEDIVYVLKRLEAFSWKEVKEEFEGLQTAWEIALSYKAFLAENDVVFQDHPVTISDLLETYPFSIQARSILEELNIKDRRILIGLSNTGEKALGNNNIDKSINNIAMAMFFTEKFPSYEALIEATCKMAAPRIVAVKMAFAYIELRERSRKENKFVSVEEVSTQWKTINEKRKESVPEGYNLDLEVIKENLAKGVWLTRLHPVVRDSFKKAGTNLNKQTKRMEKVIQDRPDAINALRRVFDTLSISTIERFLEARTIVAYLLTFNAQEGHLADLIDSLVKSKPDRYLLLQYIKQSRIGIVPRNMSFQNFCTEFEKDLIGEYQVQGNGQIKDFEMIIHRFGLADSERYDFDHFNPKAQKRKAGPNIRLLLAENLDINGLVEAAGYEMGTDDAGIKNLVSLMLEEKISHLVEKQIGQLEEVEKNYLDKNHEDWKEKLTNEFGYNNQFIQFAKNLLQQINRQNEKNYLAKLINEDPKVPQTLQNLRRCENIASFYIDTIADIASIV